MVKLTKEDVTPEPTILAKIPILNIIDDFRRGVVSWIWKMADIKGITADNVLKALFVGGIALVLMAATVGNLIYGLLYKYSPVVALFVSLMFTGYATKYWIEPKVGRLDKVQLVNAPIIIGATVVSTAFLIVAAPYIKPIADFFMGLTGATGVATQTYSLVAMMLTASSLIIKSQAGAVTISLIPVVGNFFLVAGTFALGDFLEWIVDEVRSIGKSS